jgi:hypothetical protein
MAGYRGDSHINALMHRRGRSQPPAGLTVLVAPGRLLPRRTRVLALDCLVRHVACGDAAVLIPGPPGNDRRFLSRASPWRLQTALKEDSSFF